MDLRVERSVVVITPTIGQKTLPQAVESVSRQTYKNLKHLVVVDGGIYLERVQQLNLSEYHTHLQVTIAPNNTGANGFYGHRIFAAYPHLVNEDYIVFLDEDNWFEKDHIRSLVDLIEKRKLDWAYSLRNIYTKEGEFVVPDCCESLGKWPVYWSLETQQKEYLIDTSSYCFKRDFLIRVCQNWHWGWGGDRRFYSILRNGYNHTNYDTTGLHTLNYRLDDNIEKKYGSLDFFSRGNELVKQHFHGEYPWQKTASLAAS